MMNTTAPSPKLFFDTVNGYERRAGIEVAVELDLFLASTREGDAYTLREFEEMLARAGFTAPEHHPLPPVSTAIIARK